ncbi:MAG: glycosyltransferase family 4 protein [Thermoflexales bacterium]|nr:glycosyltransferase family 4 protein [Thermoflexales bacterium]
MSAHKVLVIHNNYQQPGGETVAVQAQISLLQQYGHPVTTYWRDNREIAQYRIGQKIAFFLNTLFSLKTFNEIRALVKRERPDVAHIHNVFPLISPSVYRALKKEGVPIVQTVHNFRFLCPNALFYTHGQICERCKYGNTFHAVPRKCYRQSYILSALYALTIAFHRRWGTFDLVDRFLPVTEFVAQKLLESRLTTANKITVLGNFLPDPLPAPGSFERRESYLVYLGRLSPEKGVEVLLEAMAGLPGVTLKIAGDGPQVNVLRDRARNKEIWVEFLGHITGEQKWELLRNAMASVVPSVGYESFSLSALEAMAVGTPVVASRLGGLPYVIEDGQNGLLFRPGDDQDLREKLTWLISHPVEVLRMGQYARQVVEEKYSATAYYRQLMYIYEQVTR